MFERDWTRLHPQNLGACTQHTSIYGSMWVSKKVIDENLAYNYTYEQVFDHENDVYRTPACTWLPSLHEECIPKLKSYKILQTQELTQLGRPVYSFK